MSILFSPLSIKDITFRNRIVVSPMCQYSSRDGFANDWHLVHLGSRAAGGAGLVIQEATAVSPEGRISYADLGIWSDEHIAQLKRITSFIHEQGAVAGIQLAHAGRKASTERPCIGNNQIKEGENSWQPVAPSPIPFREGDITPAPLSQEEIRELIHQFKKAAARSLEAGYKVIEIHAAHGYLIHQFLSPLSNSREDQYGGSFENRTRFLLEIIDEVKTVWPANLPLFVRISATDWAEKGGWDPGQSVQLSMILKARGVDLIDCSTAGMLPRVSIPVGPGYQVQFAELIKKEAGVLTGAVGLITEARQAEEILQKGQADLILLARQLLRDPYFPLHAVMN
ncbi:NADH:flavin oxidoreductase/NADH oxidase [Terrimonas sp. NA20]|uniref:NADH:flavin oxidoreductase/NADH oxidase n=1 Tax=Terrimonas ginsenosidimutans TaxID=2908004 RepID=A0ABS9KY25_9BACT|nr:NADH:flavin oxidoreductase/NADH oxidase [Terrimonas ginsenosidimutans]MCG2617208.1 NADH:flavin oxidoreductase/NADH oxidase [Terrimonas ginsenosidimutans]